MSQARLRTFWAPCSMSRISWSIRVTKKLYPMLTGIAMTRPVAVVSSATLMPPATSDGSTSPAASIAANARIMPATVPRKPMSGATFAIVARMTRPRSRKPSSIAPVVLIACSSSPAWTSSRWMRRRPATTIAAAGPGLAAAIAMASSMRPSRAASSASVSTAFVLE